MNLRLPNNDEVSSYVEKHFNIGYNHNHSGVGWWVLRDSIKAIESQSCVTVSYKWSDGKHVGVNSFVLWDKSKIIIANSIPEMVAIAKDRDLFGGWTILVDDKVYQVVYSGTKRVLKRQEHLEKYVTTNS